MNRENSIASLPLRSIKIDHGIQQRDKMLDNGIVSEYAEAMKAGSKFPPIIVYADGTTNWLADGYHRVEAAEEAGQKTIAAEIRQGTKRDAILYACGANRDHGLRRSREDVRRAIETMLKDDEWGQWSDRAIADKVGCDHKTVATVRGQVGNFPTSDDDQPGDDQGDQVEKFTTCGADQPGDADADQLGNFPSSTDQPTPRPAAKAGPPKRTGRDGKSYPTTNKRKAPTSPPTSPAKAPPAPTPKVNKTKAALDAHLALTAAIGRLRPLVPDLLPSDALQCLINLKDAITLIEGHFGKEAKGHA